MGATRPEYTWPAWGTIADDGSRGWSRPPPARADGQQTGKAFRRARVPGPGEEDDIGGNPREPSFFWIVAQLIRGTSGGERARRGPPHVATPIQDTVDGSGQRQVPRSPMSCNRARPSLDPFGGKNAGHVDPRRAVDWRTGQVPKDDRSTAAGPAPNIPHPSCRRSAADRG